VSRRKCGKVILRFPGRISCHSETEWCMIIFGLDWSLLWKTLDEDVPRLGRRIEAILKDEFGEQDVPME